MEVIRARTHRARAFLIVFWGIYMFTAIPTVEAFVPSAVAFQTVHHARAINVIVPRFASKVKRFKKRGVQLNIHLDENDDGNEACTSIRIKTREEMSSVIETNTGMKESVRRESQQSRRRALHCMATAAAALSFLPPPVSAGKAEIDSKSGELFSPKNQMLDGGGSDLARGIKLEKKNMPAGREKSNSGTPLQTIYETRFITYLSRFLLNFDPAAKSWWGEQDFSEGKGKLPTESQKKLRFAEFAESVEIGLADYFVGPYGSYASVQAAKAGLLAKAPATSSSKAIKEPKSTFFESVKEKIPFVGKNQTAKPITDARSSNLAKQGILNLFSLLQARYTSPEEKHQLAILFSLISDPGLQPAKAIKGILGEADDGRITEVELVGLLDEESDNYQYRGSSHHGGGYSMSDCPKVYVDAPPALGASYKPAKINVTTKPTTRVLRIRVVDGGSGYTTIPSVEVIQKDVRVACEACAILDREGSVESVLVLNPGLGYRIDNDMSPKVIIAPPKQPRSFTGEKKSTSLYRQASAVADLEFAIDRINVVDGGNGYILSQPPNILVTPPEEDPDWYISPIDRLTWRAIDRDQIGAKVVTMNSANTGETMWVDTEVFQEDNLIASDPTILDQLKRDPLALFPSSLVPHFTAPGERILESGMLSGKNGNYRILSLPGFPSTMILPSSRYRAFDPIFGAIGSKPVTKSAQALTGSEYTRLSISGGICTVIVRTALNPLELVKTKIQLKNDEPLMQAVAKSPMPAHISHAEKKQAEVLPSEDSESKQETSIGTVDVIKTMVTMRGPLSLFQSADITFMASVVFGSFGFGATELFRRSFTMVFFPDAGAGPKGTGEELTFLLAAGLACVITSAAAAPFEILRVRSMGYVDPTPVGRVFADFVAEKREARTNMKQTTPIVLSAIKKDDIPPLFSGFFPIVSRELPFAVVKFLVFDLVASSMLSFINSQPQLIEPVQVGAGTLGLAVSAGAGAIAGLAGAFLSHPADLILTLTSSKQKPDDQDSSNDEKNDWKPIVRNLLSQDGGVLNLFAGLPARSTFFFLVIGLQFFLYDYAKNIFQVGSDDLTLVLDVFYAIRQGLQ